MEKNKTLVFLPEPCFHCGSGRGVIETTDMHKKLSCNRCDAYIKFVGKKDNLVDVEEWVDDDVNGNNQLDNQLEEINFKLDLLLDHLGVRQND